MNPCRDEIRTSPSRGRFEGVANVMRFNWPLYVIGLAMASGAISAAALLGRPRWLVALLWAGGIAASYLLIASVLVSLWVYDLSPLYRFEWARGAVPERPARILNLHSGFDESSAG